MDVTVHPYSLNGSPLDVLGGDWFVGKGAVSILLAHPILGQLQVFTTHVSRVWTSPLPAVNLCNSTSYLQKVERLGPNT